jgi:nucleoside-diphosphate-sugar epimerase
MKILVTGASGFIGSYCCSQLALQGHEVHAVSSKHQQKEIFYWHKANLLDSEQTIKLMRDVQPTHLLHLAWYAEPGKYWTSTKNYHWVKASLTLFEQFAEVGGKRIVAAGSCAEYDWDHEKYIEDITPKIPITLYGSCKHSLHLMLSSFAALNELSFAWGRVFSVYGPHENSKRLFSSVIQALLRREIVKCKNAELMRDYLHVNDVASAFVTLLCNEVQGAVNIGSGSGISLKNIVEKIERNIGNYGYLRLNEQSNDINSPRCIIADNNLLKSTGWVPTFNIDTGLDDTIEWFKKN